MKNTGHKKDNFWYRNGLSLVFLGMMLFSLTGQMYTGWKEHNEFLQEEDAPPVEFVQYLGSGHFIQATFENWESEFLQMALFVVLTIFLRQKGSSESKQPDEENEDPAAELQPHDDSPWPVKKGGIILVLYKHSLSISLFVLFVMSFALHWYGSWKDYNLRQQLEQLPETGFLPFLKESKLWFESFQNWQSEFLSVFAIVFLSIYLRQIGSPQSKKVNEPHSETGE